MQEFLTYKGWIVAGAFLFLFSLEHLRPAVAAGTHPVRRLIKNLSFWPVNMALSLLIVLPISYLAAQHALWTRPDWLSGLRKTRRKFIVRYRSGKEENS